MSAEKYEAMTDDELNQQAARRVMGWNLVTTQKSVQSWWHDGDGPVARANQFGGNSWFNPAQDRNQSGQLLAKMVERGCSFTTLHCPPYVEYFSILRPSMNVFLPQHKGLGIQLPDGNDARAETVAALVAFDALEGKAK